MKNFITRNRLFALLSFLLILLIWALMSVFTDSSLLLPGPGRVMTDLVSILTDYTFIQVVSFTFIRYVTGFLLALAASLIIGGIAGFSTTFYALFKPVLVVFRSVPVISFILLALIWFTNYSVPVFIAFITMFPIICMSIIDGIHQIDRQYFDLSYVFQISRRQQLKDVILPAIASFLFSGMATALGFGWRAVIIGEVLSQPDIGIGTEMQKAHIYLMISNLIAWTLIAVLISYVLDSLLRKAEKYIFKWKASDQA